MCNIRVVLAVVLVANFACGRTVLQSSSTSGSSEVAQSLAAPPRVSRLAQEKSPYLLAHAKNPVDWFPWGDEAFATAKSEGKPVFLSIGYSTCHWCHVMERESFEDPEIAAFLNEHFVSVKVDREERPDVDAVYIEYVRARTGGAGWPLTVVLTADRHPFFGGTYFPPRNVDEPGRSLPGLLELLKVIADDWKVHRSEIEAGAGSVAEALVAAATTVKPRAWGFDAAATVATQRLSQWKSERESGAAAPRFPEPMTIDFLIHREVETGDATCLQAATELLDEMLRGGIFDPIGGGFARYSVDERFLVPHFEKMLYVNALLARTFALAFQRTRDERYADVVVMTLEYLLREMRVEEAAFATAEDADSRDEKGNLVEGLFYTFTPAEVRAALSPDLAEVAISAFCLEESGHLEGRSIPNRLCGREFDDKKFEMARRAMFELRAGRARPLRDDKVLAGDNGLAISAFALAGRVLKEPRYLAAAREAADFVRTKLVDEDSGVVLRRYRVGESALPGQLADYAFLAQGLLDLYSSTFDPRDLELAISIVDQSIVKFFDDKAGVLYDAPLDSTDLIARPRDAVDGAVPAPTAIALKNFVRVARLTGRRDLEELARRCLDAYADEVERVPLAFVSLIEAERELSRESLEAVFAGELGSAELEALIDAYFAKPRPGYVIAHASSESHEFLGELIEGRIASAGDESSARLYLCRGRVCAAPISDPREIP